MYRLLSHQANAPIRGGLLALAAGLLLVLFVAPAAAKEPQTDNDKALYYMGVVVSQNLSGFDLTPEETAMVMQGMQDALEGKTQDIDHQSYGPLAQEFAQTRSLEVAEREKAKSQEFLTEAAKAKGAKTTESGLIFTEEKAGSGESPSPTDTVKVHYHGTLRDGTVFDSSIQRGTPAEFPLNRVIPCWTEGVAMMKPGGKAKLICPSEIAYGDQGQPPVIPGGAALVFDVELIEVVGQ
ncbi:MAG: hypothetical protein CBC48_03640 [bacterium TMED88]|nr:peptidylprolyl isomerase [Deltaproteobacteria bacterium]OUV35605.1 MAG: hypothetical protein CBC48_03640 [bacterium TMED88]